MFVQKSQKYILTYKLTSLNNIATPPHESPVTKNLNISCFRQIKIFWLKPSNIKMHDLLQWP